MTHVKGAHTLAVGVDALVFVAAPMINTEPTSEAALTVRSFLFVVSLKLTKSALVARR